MKTFMSMLLLAVVSISGWAQDGSAETKSSAIGQKSPQEIKLDKVMMDRFKEIERYLPSGAKRKAKSAGEAFGKRLALSAESDDLYQLAKDEIDKHFKALTQEQLDVLVFYTLVKTAQAKNTAASRGTARGGKRSQLFDTLSKIMERYDQSAKNVIQNIRG